jgi:hypothetical protein
VFAREAKAAKGNEAWVSELWRDPRRAWLLMTAWFLVSLATGPVVSVHVSADGSPRISILTRLIDWALSAFFAWRVTRGGRVSRLLLILANGSALIALVMTLAADFRPQAAGAKLAELGMVAALAAQVALLMSPAVYRRTRPGGQPGEMVALWRRRWPGPLVTALAAGAALGLIGAAVCAAAIGDRIREYDSATVRVPAGHTVSLLLSPGDYGAFTGCADHFGCPFIKPRDLSIRGISGAVTAVDYEGIDGRTDAGQPFARALKFTIPIMEPVWFTLHRDPGQPVLIAPAETKKHMVKGWVVAAGCCGLLFLGSLAGLAWPVRRRTAAGGWQP